MENLKSEGKFDCIIIGAGPAGVSASITCLQRGLKVLLIGKDDSINQNNFIESYSPGIISLFKKLDIETNIESKDWVAGKFSYISNGKDFKSLNPYSEEVWYGYHVYKNKFSKFLKDQVLLKNIPFLNEIVIEIVYHSNEIRGVKTACNKIFLTDYLIDATGNTRLIGRKLKFRNSIYSSPYVVQSAIISDSSHYFDRKNDYAYLLPKESGWEWLVSLSDGSLGRTELLSKRALKSEKFDSFKNTNGVVQSNMRWRIFRPVCKDGVLLCGDAASIIDPASGQGVISAINQGINAATVVYNSKMNPNLKNFLLASYDSLLLSDFESKVNQLREAYHWLRD